VRTPATATPVTRVRVRVNGQEVPQAAETRGQRPVREETRNLTVELPSDDAEVQLIAENAAGASVPVVVRVRYQGEKKAASGNDLYVLAVGVSAYDKPEYRLGLAAKDAEDFVKLIRQQEGSLYRKVVVRTLVDSAASKQSVEAALAWLKDSVGPRDTAMVFLAGHGINDGRGDYLYLPRDADVARLQATGVPFSLIRRTLTSLPGRTLMFVDTCHAGNVVGSARQRLCAPPLAGLRVLDLTRLLPGPLASMHLADLGADVIKIEDTGAGDYARSAGAVHGDISYFQLVNRNKRSLTLDLKQAAGVDASCAWQRLQMSSSRAFAPASSTSSASVTRRCARSIRASCTARSPATGRTGRTVTAPATTSTTSATAACSTRSASPAVLRQCPTSRSATCSAAR
jgi:hypothetical protein